MTIDTARKALKAGAENVHITKNNKAHSLEFINALNIADECMELQDEAEVLHLGLFPICPKCRSIKIIDPDTKKIFSYCPVCGKKLKEFQ